MRIQKTLSLAVLAVATFAITACQDGGSAPAAPESALRPEGPRLTLATASVTTAWLNPTYDNVYVSPEGHRLTIPAYAICNPATSGYGAAVWNQACTPATAPILFTITSTVDAGGRPRITVLPDVRFSPSKTVVASFADAAAAAKFGSLIQYCPLLGACVDESLTDASLRTYTDKATGRVYRRLKHFSGYTVIVGADCEDPYMCERGFDRESGASGEETAAAPGEGTSAERSGYITTTGRTLGQAR